MAKNKTVETENSVSEYVSGIQEDKRRNDCSELIKTFSKHSGFEAKMWGTGIVGFGSYHYKYESGHEGDAPIIGLSSRSKAISLYLPAFEKRDELLSKFGKHKTGKGCIYIQKMEDIDRSVLEDLIKSSVKHQLETLNK